MENIFLKMMNIIQDNIKMTQEMGKEYYIIRMEILNMKEILLMENVKEMENIFLKMVNIIQAYLKII